MTFADSLGFAGVALLLLAFLLNLLKIVDHNNRLYISFNLIGAGMACAASLLINYIPFVVLEGVWALVSAAALVRSFITIKH
ncbi:MAG: hypothetical protein KIS94_09335 [Chitinophagales bacterium]|nr:hypothetical protein [Chitinophagales bacterium]